jgi:hypothetical protein
MDWKIWPDSAILDEANIDALFSSNIGGSLTFPVEGTFKGTHTFIHHTALELELKMRSASHEWDLGRGDSDWPKSSTLAKLLGIL